MSTPKQQKGFAVMDKERHRKLASLGGITSHALGVAHVFTPEEAAAAGRKGGLMRAKKQQEKLSNQS